MRHTSPSPRPVAGLAIVILRQAQDSTSSGIREDGRSRDRSSLKLSAVPRPPVAVRSASRRNLFAVLSTSITGTEVFLWGYYCWSRFCASVRLGLQRRRCGVLRARMLFDQIVSLGPTCKARYQVERAKQATRFTTLRNSPANFPKSIFSWQITPIEAVIEGIRCDFLGMFEAEDLFVDTDGVVVNRRFGTRHVHEFPKPPRNFNIEDHYEQARGRHDHLCNLTRNALDVAAKRTLFVFGGYSSSKRVGGERPLLGRNHAPISIEAKQPPIAAPRHDGNGTGSAVVQAFCFCKILNHPSADTYDHASLSEGHAKCVSPAVYLSGMNNRIHNELVNGLLKKG